MPTIIDSLIVELGLDPKGFVAGRQTAEREMRALKDLAQKASGASAVDQVNIRKQFDALGKSAGASKDQLNAMWTDLHKNVTATVKPVEAVTLSTRNLVAAGTAVFAVFTAVKGALRDVGNAINNTVSTGYSARFAGVPGQWLSAFSTAGRIKTGADKQQTESWVADLRTELEGFQTPGSPTYGKWTGRMNALAMMGLDATSLTRDPQELISQISEHLSQLDPTKQRAAAQGLGLPDRLGAFLGQGSAAVNSQTNQAAQVAVTQKQIEQFDKLAQAIRSVEESWDGFIRKLIEDHPGLQSTTTALDDWLKELQHNPEEMHAVELALDALAVAFGTTLVAGIAKAMVALNAFWALPVIKFLAKPIVSGPLAFLLGMTPGSAGAGENQAIKAFKDLSPADQQRALRGELPLAPDTRTPWERNAPSWLGGKPRNQGYVTGASRGGDPRGVESALRASAAKHGWNPDDVVKVARAEGLGAANYGTWDVNGMSYGALQGHIGGLATDFQKATGIDPSKPENENALNDWLLGYAKVHGWGKWTSVTGGKVAAPRRDMGRMVTTALSAPPAPPDYQDRLFAAGPKGQFRLPPDTKFNSRGQPISPSLATMSDKERIQQEATYAWLRSHPGGVWGTARAAQASAGASGNTVNHGDTHVTVGDVHTQADDAAGVARDLKQELQDQFSVTHSNVGIE